MTVFFYSGSSGVVAKAQCRGKVSTLWGEPEHALPERGVKPDLMLSYYLVTEHMQGQQLRLPVIEAAKKKPEAAVGQFFLDSGAHSLYTAHVIKKGHAQGYAFYDTPEFWKYVDAYAQFVKDHSDCIDHYANVDVIFDPERSWKVLKYLEDKHGLSPVPVVHYGTPLSWVEKHLASGYTYLGLGGLGQEATAGAYQRWADQVYRLLCPPPRYLPIVKTHGFAMTAYNLLTRYPWYSVDSATWTKVGANGGIFVPHKRGGRFTFSEKPYQMAISTESKPDGKFDSHYEFMSPLGKKIVREWLDEIGVPLGENHPTRKEHNEKGVSRPERLKFGVINRHSERKIANLLFFERLRMWLPEYPWPFRPVSTPTRTGLI